MMMVLVMEIKVVVAAAPAAPAPAPAILSCLCVHDPLTSLCSSSCAAQGHHRIIMATGHRAVVLLAATLLSFAVAVPPPTPVWPDQFHAILLQNRNGSLADVDLYYDWPGGRNLNIIKSRDDGSVLYDNERMNGSTYYYHPGQGDCKVLDMHVGILRPNWLEGADYHGQEVVNGRKVIVWSKDSSIHRPFVTYYEDVETTDPVAWVFFDGGRFDVVKWLPSETLIDSEWQLPAVCFENQVAVERVRL